MAEELPGKEIPKEYREVADHLVRKQGWRYDASGKGYPRLYPADASKPMLTVPKTPTSDKRAFKNWVSEVRRRGGQWPPPKG